MKVAIAVIMLVTGSCKQPKTKRGVASSEKDTTFKEDTIVKDATEAKVTGYQQGERINTGSTKVAEVLAYAETLIGTPYKYGSADPDIGFDCSGFITHVF